jgi:NitT/TauT family transport system permease protein
MVLAYILPVLFTLIYGYIAAYNWNAERVFSRLLDILQRANYLISASRLIELQFFLSQRFVIDLASIILIFITQVWNMIFAWYQSLKDIPM